MATIEITELEAATSFGSGDLGLIRKSGETKDRKISQQNFIKSIGNPAVKGFIASSDEANKVTLNPSNGTVIDTYYNAMEVSFIAPITSTGLVQVRIGALAYKDLFILGTTTSVQLSNGASYVQAYYDQTNDKFYQTNSPAAQQAYSSFYKAEGVVAGDQSTTTYTLTSAFGLTDQNYYDKMGIIFTADIASKGGVLVNIDGLGNKVLTDKAGDKIANDLQQNQVILAIYDGTNFIKSYFSEEVPEAPELPAEAFDDQGQIIPENVPEDNKLTVSVGTAGNTYTTINAAIADLIDNFGNDGGNRLVTINLSNTYTWTETIVVDKGDLSWITINGSNTTIGGISSINITGKTYIIVKNNAISFNLSGTFDFYVPNVSAIFCDCKGEISTFNATFNANTGFSRENIRWFLGNDNSSKLNMKNTDITAGYIISGNFNLNLDTINMYPVQTTPVSGAITGTITSLNMNVTNNLGNNRIVDLVNSYNLIINNSSIIDTVNNNQTFNCTYSKNITLNNTNVKGLGQNILAQSGSEININGGDFRKASDNSTSNQNIISTGQGSLIRLINNPLGGTSAINSGIITTA